MSLACRLRCLHLASAAINMSGLNPISFAGVLDMVQPHFSGNPSLNQLDEQAVIDDLEGEQETVVAPDRPGPEEGADSEANLMGLVETVKEVSKGVSDGTHAEYQRYVVSPSWSHSYLTPVSSSLINQCEEFIVQKGLLPRGQFFSNRPCKYAPELIVAWIMDA